MCEGVRLCVISHGQCIGVCMDVLCVVSHGQ